MNANIATCREDISRHRQKLQHYIENHFRHAETLALASLSQRRDTPRAMDRRPPSPGRPTAHRARPALCPTGCSPSLSWSSLMVVVGGITRLTESGLSITEWKPVTRRDPAA